MTVNGGELRDKGRQGLIHIENAMLRSRLLRESNNSCQSEAHARELRESIAQLQNKIDLLQDKLCQSGQELEKTRQQKQTLEADFNSYRLEAQAKIRNLKGEVERLRLLTAERQSAGWQSHAQGLAGRVRQLIKRLFGGY
jgi:chromosome segregation ATPase